MKLFINYLHSCLSTVQFMLSVFIYCSKLFLVQRFYFTVHILLSYIKILLCRICSILPKLVFFLPIVKFSIFLLYVFSQFSQHLSHVQLLSRISLLGQKNSGLLSRMLHSCLGYFLFTFSGSFFWKSNKQCFHCHKLTHVDDRYPPVS